MLQNVQTHLTFLACIGVLKLFLISVIYFSFPYTLDYNYPTYFYTSTGNLENYYKQITLEEAFNTEGWGFPNAIYLNAVSWEGTIRTGTQNLWGAIRGNNSHLTTSYSYVDTLVAYNLNLVCSPSSTRYNDSLTKKCEPLWNMLQKRRSNYPLTRWDDPVYGRLADWPPL